jgi:hypothetical protein
MSTHALHVYEYVNRPYANVSSLLKLDAIGVFQRATASATARAKALVSTMRATVGPVELGADVLVRIDGVEESPDAPRGPRTRLRLSWKAKSHPEMFPTMEATLDAYALGPNETQLDFQGEYRPPLGVVGAVLDAVAGHRIAEAAVHRFVEEIAERMRVDAGVMAHP